MNEFFKKPVVKILMLKGEKGDKGNTGTGTPKGGKTGQYLLKKSDADYDYVWSPITTVSWDNVSGKTDATTSASGLMSAEDKSKLDNLQVGGRNLIRNSKFTNTSWSGTNGIEIINANGSRLTYTTDGIRTVRADGWGGTAVLIRPDVVPLEYEKTVTLSFDLKIIKMIKTDRLRFDALANSADNSAWYAQSIPNTNTGLDVAKNDPNNWHRVSCTIKIPAKNSLYENDRKVLIRLVAGQDGADYEYYMKNLKLEYGTVATDWTPALEDMKLESYPVGSIYISENSTSPAELFGGTWEQLKDRFMLAAGDTYTAGSTGGESQHTLTVDEMPKHRHSSDDYLTGYPSGDRIGEDKRCTWLNKGQADANNPETGETGPIRTSWVGGSQPHNNMPPYLAVYMWKRIA